MSGFLHLPKLPDVAGMYADIGAALAGEFDAELFCYECEHLETVNAEQAGRYVRNGWPTHCGQTMAFQRRLTRSHRPHGDTKK